MYKWQTKCESNNLSEVSGVFIPKRQLFKGMCLDFLLGGASEQVISIPDVNFKLESEEVKKGK